jgi:hypothetical protein
VGGKKSNLLRLLLCPQAVLKQVRACFGHCERGSECTKCKEGERLHTSDYNVTMSVSHMCGGANNNQRRQ